ncbi:MAG: 50S ribosomal protein L25/general stress protein Ctc [Proteobacteria bacterium]|nr:50S ribosomal protein L25/general stress protein Ctc [Pseudomonadota bacterium]
MERFEITVNKREPKGKGAARKLRAQGLIPAVFYGPEIPSTAVVIEKKDMLRILERGQNVLINLRIKDGDGKKGGSDHVVMVRECQLDPLKGAPIHVDFLEISMEEKMTVEVPIRLMGKPEGTKIGGVLEQIRRELEIECLPKDLPPAIEVDVSHLEIGDSMHVEDISAEKFKILTEPHMTIATVVPPTVEKEPEPEEVPEEVEEEAEAPAEVAEETEEMEEGEKEE